MNNNENQPNNNQNDNQNNEPTQPVKTVVVNNDNNRNFMRIAGIVVIIVVLLALASNGKWMKKDTDDADKNVSTLTDRPEGCKDGYLFSETTGKPCPQPAAVTAIAVTAAAQSGPGGYEEAIRMYAGKVVLFDASCAPLPAVPSFALGTRILIANNSAATITLAVPGKSESLSPYHYFTTRLKTAGEVAVTCNGKPAAIITVK